MNLDLSRALDDLAARAAARSDLGPAERIVARRRRRRVVRRGAASATSLVVVGGMVLAGVAVADRRVADGQPSVVGPAPTATASTGPAPSTGTGLPGCGEPVPAPAATATQVLDVTSAARDAVADSITVSLTLVGASAAELQTAEVRLYVPYGGDGDHVLEVAELPPGGWADTPDGATLDATGPSRGCPGMEPFGLTLVAAVRTAGGVVVSEAVVLDTAS